MSPLLKNKKMISSDSILLRKYCLISAGLAALVMFILFIFHQNTLVFGDNTVLRMDLYHQYGPLYAEVYDRITSGSSLIYSWTSGLGGSFLGNLFNYCASPFAFIILLLGHKNMPEAIAVMIMLKAMLASACFTYYSNKTNGSVRKESIAFGLLYAFSNYFIAYSWNIMWLDAFAIFPLVMLGIENIINRNKPGLYVFGMTFTMITNYYMAYMVCIFSVMYFLYYYFGRYELTSSIIKKAPEIINSDIAVDEPVEADLDIIDNTLPDSKELYMESIDESLVENSSDDNGKIKKKHNKVKNKRLRNNRFWVTGFSFALASFLCFALAAFALFPISYCLQSSSATTGTFPEDSKQYFDIFNFIANHLPGVDPTIRSSGDNVVPNVYCGLLTIILLPIYFFNSKIPGKQKVVSSILLISCFIGFVYNQFNFIWHGMHMPNDLPYRWSFAYIFILISIAYKAYLNIEEFSKKAFIGIGFAIFGFVILVQKFEVPNCKELCILLTVIFTILYIVIFGMMKSQKYKQNALVFLLFFTIILEIVGSGGPNIVMSQPKKSYTEDYTYYKEISSEVEKDETELFYRTELTKLRARMDPCWYGYNGTSTFSSMAYERTAKLMKKMGMFSNNINSYTYYPQTPVFNSMFNLKYLYDNKDLIKNETYYTATENTNQYFDAYEYNYYLPLIFSVDDNITDWDTSNNNPFTVQNDLIKKATAIEDIFSLADATNVTLSNINDIGLDSINSNTSFTVNKTKEAEEGKITIKLKPEQEGSHYVYVGSTKVSSIKIQAGELTYDYASSSIQPFTLDVGNLSVDDEIVVEYIIPKDNASASVTFAAARIDDDKFISAYNKIKSNGLINMIEFDETLIKGNINISNQSPVIWTSIPYDDSWSIIVDGKELSYTKYDDDNNITTEGDIFKLGNGLIGIKTVPGEHEITMRYVPKGLSQGLMFTIVGIIILVLIGLIKTKLYPVLEKKKLIPFFLKKINNE